MTGKRFKTGDIQSLPSIRRSITTCKSARSCSQTIKNALIGLVHAVQEGKRIDMDILLRRRCREAIENIEVVIGGSVTRWPAWPIHHVRGFHGHFSPHPPARGSLDRMMTDDMSCRYHHICLAEIHDKSHLVDVVAAELDKYPSQAMSWAYP